MSDHHSVNSSAPEANGWGKAPFNRLERSAARWIVRNTKGATRSAANGLFRHYGEVLVGMAFAGIVTVALVHSDPGPVDQEAKETQQDSAPVIANLESMEQQIEDAENAGTTLTAEDFFEGHAPTYQQILYMKKDAVGKVMCRPAHHYEEDYEDPFDTPCSDLVTAKQQVESLGAKYNTEAKNKDGIAPEPFGIENKTGNATCKDNGELVMCESVFASRAAGQKLLGCVQAINPSFKNMEVDVDSVMGTIASGKRSLNVMYDLYYNVAIASYYDKSNMTQYVAAPYRKDVFACLAKDKVPGIAKTYGD